MITTIQIQRVPYRDRDIVMQDFGLDEACRFSTRVRYVRERPLGLTQCPFYLGVGDDCGHPVVRRASAKEKDCGRRDNKRSHGQRTAESATHPGFSPLRPDSRHN